MSMEISILRLGHRLPRDERITTHVGLVARAFGAGEIIYAGQHDSSFEESVKKINENWGGKFEAKYAKNPLKLANEYKKNGFAIVHLTMYGLPLPEKLDEMRKSGKILVIVGAEQVPREFYEIADFNISITSQPHSEVAALAITLDRLMEAKELGREFSERFKGKIGVEPSGKGKKVRKL
ncbi:tRNA (cytidine(56)-2'-O)-methyltransferase [uncultured archaeon]|nr:tRNA (cytidine(56)-2'-O)-methyltransferase [uncultured archaeon]